MTGAPSLRPGSFEAFAQILRDGSGLAIGPDKTYLLEARLTPLLREHGLGSLDALAERSRVPTGSALRAQIIEAMTTNESFFFRDTKPFSHLETKVLPRLHAARPAGAPLRVWSAAASSGQEAYSVAMIAADGRAGLNGRSVEIVGTDIAREPLARAREGTYTQFEVQRGLPMRLLAKHFVKEGAQWRVAPTLRAGVSFREWNLLADPSPLGRFDVVFCRNVLIYFDPPTKARVLAGIARQLAPDGVLYLGGAETVIGISDHFVADERECGAYRLAGAPSVAVPVLAQAATGAAALPAAQLPAPRPAAAPAIPAAPPPAMAASAAPVPPPPAPAPSRALARPAPPASSAVSAAPPPAGLRHPGRGTQAARPGAPPMALSRPAASHPAAVRAPTSGQGAANAAAAGPVASRSAARDPGASSQPANIPVAGRPAAPAVGRQAPAPQPPASSLRPPPPGPRPSASPRPANDPRPASSRVPAKLV